METTYYLMPVYGSVDPLPLKGPYADWPALVRAARVVRRQQEEEDALFWVAVGPDGRPETGAFGHGELFPETPETAQTEGAA